MNRLRFLLARTLRDEGTLQRLSVPESEVMAQLAGKSVALIGNARSLAEGQRGAEIDAADLVIRINRAPMPSAVSHGTRTDILALATSIPQADLDRLGPARVLWMSHKRKRLPFAIAASPGFHLPELSHFNRLKAELGAPPTTGLMLIDLLSRSHAREIRLYGFDFFTTLSLSGRRTAEQVPHDFAAERAFVQALMARDHRFAQIAAT
ncbi:glycosyltransferase family 29 protein [Fuscibacter oryzae]|uniref:Glycosyltransferase family 29 protein n=1 Tax=Fuscibacter oryzae TaxID=2803939 RepID=A0A8J7MXE3_9RHOB|nr:glycosyltransferase family 29 protein [Fuscibacter oryzae]MBL4929599.1 glycosyltransferase family 29 protein [Fuscibacter oryzae]